MNYYETNKSYFEKAVQIVSSPPGSPAPSVSLAQLHRKPAAQIVEIDETDDFDSNLDFLRSHFKSKQHVVEEATPMEVAPPREAPPGAAPDTEFLTYTDAKPDPFAYVDDSDADSDYARADERPVVDSMTVEKVDTGAGVGGDEQPSTAEVKGSTEAERKTEMNREIRREGRQRWRRVGEVEDQFYDAKKDDKDEKFMREMRQRHLPKSMWNLPPTTILSCPCCFTVVCLDCQRHDQYINQYRAMFVLNTITSTTEVLRYSNSNPTAPPVREFYSVIHTKVSDDDTIYRPVHCASCATELGVMDADELVHFYNVMAEDP